jgi:hypothetical protein
MSHQKKALQCKRCQRFGRIRQNWRYAPSVLVAIRLAFASARPKRNTLNPAPAEKTTRPTIGSVIHGKLRRHYQSASQLNEARRATQPAGTKSVRPGRKQSSGLGNCWKRVVQERRVVNVTPAPKPQTTPLATEAPKQAQVSDTTKTAKNNKPPPEVTETFKQVPVINTEIWQDWQVYR